MDIPFDLADFLRSDLQAMTEYKPGKSAYTLSAELGVEVDAIRKLDANENPYGPSPAALQALCNYRYYHLYPDADQMALRRALAGYVGLDMAHIIAGNGSDEVIDLVLRLFLNPGDVVINCPPTFGVYAFLATLHRACVVNVPRRDDFSLDVEEIEHRFRTGEMERAKLLIIASPNNPDGSQALPDEIERLLCLPIIVVLDEAYVEFSGGSLSAWVARFPNLIVLRTFSKWLGLAGLRIGYGLFPLPIATQVWKIKPPYNVNAAAQVAALAALSDLTYHESQKARLLAERERLYAALQGISFLQVYPSCTNFVLARVRGRPVAQVREALEEAHILVRRFSEPELADCLRFSVGRPEDTKALLAVLRSLEAREG